MAEAWDWRQSYLEYSDTREDQGLPYPIPQSPGVPAPAAFPPPAASQSVRGLSIAAFISGGLALLLLPFILGPLGMIFGFVAKSKGDRIGKWAGLMSIATTVLGLVFSIWVAGHVRVGFRG
ncbi:MAG: hypothetical protein JWL57_393 [Actinobacteria bacterium]|nr:hypothetical protein [Actinomycetota bacterium]